MKKCQTTPPSSAFLVRLSLIALACIFPMQSFAQAPSPDPPAFAVATIRPGTHQTQDGQRPYRGGYSAKDVTVKDLIAFAYGLPFGTDGLISGGPAWAYTDTFVIEAKSANDIEAAPDNDASAAHFTELDRLMLQNLLATRFKLKIHRQARLTEGFALTVANASKLVHSTGSVPPPADPARTYSFGANLPAPQADHPTIQSLARGNVQADRVNMSWLAGYLQFQPEANGHTVTDKTGLTGDFKVSLKWSPESTDASDSPNSNSDLPGLFTALEEQLGLRLQKTKVPVDSITIDNLEHPSQN